MNIELFSEKGDFLCFSIKLNEMSKSKRYDEMKK